MKERLEMQNKEIFLAALPIAFDDCFFRAMNRDDLDLRANWPSYPEYYEMFNASFKDKPLLERDLKWRKIKENTGLICLALENNTEKLLGVFYLAEINWNSMTVGNMTIRIHPDWCNIGIGTKALTALSNWCMAKGLKRIRLDVLSTNQRAIKSYLKSGFCITGEFIQDDDLFYWMEKF